MRRYETNAAWRRWLPAALAVVMVLGLGVHLVAQAQQPPRERPQRGGAERSERPDRPDRSQRSERTAEPAQLPDGPVTLRYRFSAGDERRFRLTEEARETTEDRGREVTQQRTTEITYRQRIDEVHEDRDSATLSLAYERIRYRQLSTLNPTALTFDSAAGEPPIDPALRPYAHLAGATISLELGTSGEVHKVDGYSALLDDMFAELEEKPFEQLRMLLEQQFSDEAMRTALSYLYVFLPRRAIGPGDYWEQQLEKPIAFVGTLRSETRYTLRRFIHDDAGRAVAVIGVETRYRHGSSSEESAPGGLEVVPGVKGRATLQEGELRGTVQLDLASGLVVASELDQRMVLTFQAQHASGQGAVVDLRSTTEAAIRLERID